MSQNETKTECNPTDHNFTPPVKDGLGMRSICTKCGKSKYY